MSATQIGQRLLTQESRISGSKIRSGLLTNGDFQRLQTAAGRCYEAPLFVADTPNMKMLDLRAMARKMRQQYQVQIIFIDYIGLITSENYNSNVPRHEQVSEISRSLKLLAKEFEIPVITLSQLSRAVEQRPDKRPMLSDLRESGAIEQDADLVMFIYRDDYYNHDTEKKDIAEIIIAKQRAGSIGTVELAWLPRYTKFANLEK